jgi:hypothetical protein
MPDRRSDRVLHRKTFEDGASRESSDFALSKDLLQIARCRYWPTERQQEQLFSTRANCFQHNLQTHNGLLKLIAVFAHIFQSSRQSEIKDEGIRANFREPQSCFWLEGEAEGEQSMAFSLLKKIDLRIQPEPFGFQNLADNTINEPDRRPVGNAIDAELTKARQDLVERVKRIIGQDTGDDWRLPTAGEDLFGEETFGYFICIRVWKKGRQRARSDVPKKAGAEDDQ